jgi:antitoxin component YwqK of YwqJK toxin-antitoxin module
MTDTDNTSNYNPPRFHYEPVREFWPNGKLKISGYYLYHEKHSLWTRYHENGNLHAIAYYNRGKPCSKWDQYDTNGIFISSISFESTTDDTAIEFLSNFKEIITKRKYTYTDDGVCIDI